MADTATQYTIITIFPEVVSAYTNASILGRGQKAGAIAINVVDLRDFTSDKHRTVDDTPYGGGPGMILKPEPIFAAVDHVREQYHLTRGDGTHLILLTDPRGEPFTQQTAQAFSKLQHLIIICGRYEGVDERVRQELVDRSISVGPYVLSGGELPALTITEATARLVSGVLGAQESLQQESHRTPGELEYPQYTKPAEFRGHKVPDILLSGDHAAIARWRSQQQP